MANVAEVDVGLNPNMDMVALRKQTKEAAKILSNLTPNTKGYDNKVKFLAQTYVKMQQAGQAKTSLQASMIHRDKNNLSLTKFQKGAIREATNQADIFLRAEKRQKTSFEQEQEQKKRSESIKAKQIDEEETRQIQQMYADDEKAKKIEDDEKKKKKNKAKTKKVAKTDIDGRLELVDIQFKGLIDELSEMQEKGATASQFKRVVNAGGMKLLKELVKIEKDQVKNGIRQSKEQKDLSKSIKEFVGMSPEKEGVDIQKKEDKVSWGMVNKIVMTIAGYKASNVLTNGLKDALKSIKSSWEGKAQYGEDYNYSASQLLSTQTNTPQETFDTLQKYKLGFKTRQKWGKVSEEEYIARNMLGNFSRSLNDGDLYDQALALREDQKRLGTEEVGYHLDAMGQDRSLLNLVSTNPEILSSRKAFELYTKREEEKNKSLEMPTRNTEASLSGAKNSLSNSWKNVLNLSAPAFETGAKALEVLSMIPEVVRRSLNTTTEEAKKINEQILIDLKVENKIDKDGNSLTKATATTNNNNLGSRSATVSVKGNTSR